MVMTRQACGRGRVGPTWRPVGARVLEDRGVRVSIPNPRCIDFKFGQDYGQGREPVKILGGSSVEESGGITTGITQKVSAAWINRMKCNRVRALQQETEWKGCQTSSGIRCRDVGSNERTRSTK